MLNSRNLLITVSLVIWFGIIIFEILRYRRKYLISFVIQFLFIIIIARVLNLYFGYFNTSSFKGGPNISEVWTLGGLYISTVLGILGHHVFMQIKPLKKPGKQPKIKWMPVIKPLVISPIVFLAVLNQLEQIGAQTNATTLKPVVMQFILAFQNGFFWKTVIEQFEKEP